MGKIFEAIARAEKEDQQNYLLPVRRNEILPALTNAVPGLAEPKEEWFRELETRLRTRNQNSEIQTIMFTGVAVGCGTTTVAARFASNLAKHYNSKIMLIDANFRNPTLHRVFDGDNAIGLRDILDQNGSEGELSDISEHGKVFVLTCDERQEDFLGQLGTGRFKDFMGDMKKKFDYVIVDAPPIATFSEAKLISTKVDGVILIIESGRSRKHVALKAMAEIDAAGGKLIGVILNKRKFYIPKWLYRKL